MQIEGKNAVTEILNNRDTVDKILIAKNTTDNDLVAKIKQSGIRYQFIDRAALDKMSQTRNHQGFIAIASEFKYSTLEEIMKEGGVVLLLDGIEDPGNLGAIIRTAECMGIAGIIIPKNRSASVTETAIRVSAGAASHIKIARVTNLNDAMKTLQENGFWVYAAEVGGQPLSKVSLTGKIGIIMGGEDTGVSHLTKKRADGIISIPMWGKLNSLNVSAATAIVLYEIRRQSDNPH